MGVFAIVTPVLFRNAARAFDSDEARHAVDGLQITADLLGLRVGMALRHLYLQPWYPPALSVYLAPFFAVLGPHYWAARLPMLMLLMIDLALVYRAAIALWRSHLAAIIALALVATSTPMWVLGLLCMEEMLAIGLTALVVLAWYAGAARCQVAPKARIQWLIGLTVALTALTRTSTGLFVAGAVLLAIWTGPTSPRRKLTLSLRAVAPAALVAALWWLTPAKQASLIDYLRASTPAFRAWSGGVLAYYWRSVVTTYAVAPGVGVLLLVGAGAAAVHWRDRGARLLAAIVLATWVGLLLSRSLDVRFFVGAYPALCLLGARGALDLAERARQLTRARSARAVVAALALSLLSYAGAWVYARAAALPATMDVMYETAPGHARTLDWIVDRFSVRPAFLINGYDQLSVDALEFHLASRVWPRWHGRSVIDVALEDPEIAPEAVDRFRDDVLANAPSQLVHLGNTPVPSAAAWWAYAAAIASCWDGTWHETGEFELRLWDSRAAEIVMAHPRQAAGEGDELALQDRYWYLLPIEVGLAVCRLE